LAGERKKFFNSKNYTPSFRYKPIPFDTHKKKWKIFQIPVSKIEDPVLKRLYIDILEDGIKLVELLESIGSEEFLYNSIRIFGKPSERDLKNAKYILHLGKHGEEEKRLNDKETKALVENYMREYGLKCSVKISRSISANAMVLNSSKTVYIRSGATFSESNAHALAHHEVGIHLLTTVNANLQPLKVFRVGTPNNTMTGEGMAMLNEYLSGNLRLERLRELALRVIAVDLLVKGRDFQTIFKTLHEEYGASEDTAFNISVRVWRGGGFTKDWLYLRGFIQILDLFRREVDLKPLLIGKSSIEYFETIRELIERGILNSPKNIPLTFEKPENRDEVFEYILDGLKS
jgi:uncharacterized protein (TIGR02421 family)